jgi:hypothetical protein
MCVKTIFIIYINGGGVFKYHDRRSKSMKDVTAKVDLTKPKLLVLSGPKLHKKVKFELPFLFTVHAGWTSPSIKELARESRCPKEISLSLEGKTTIDLACRGVIEDAKVFLLYMRSLFYLPPAHTHTDLHFLRVHMIKIKFIEGTLFFNICIFILFIYI